MKPATVRDLRGDFPKIEAWLAGGGKILITRHSKLIAKPSAANHAATPLPPLPDFEARLNKTWGDRFFTREKVEEMHAVLRLSRVLAAQTTATGGRRTLDIFQVATAVHLGTRRFLTFDARQQALATHAGLEVPG
ncbi:MAG: hypothetical protein NTW21_21855 [Verrucomicrobia bacterium]|nr:hypothetical protein [Verrucomicrobiota bacterium]